MIWLLQLYPPRWRRRYGEEFRALISGQRFSIGNAVDVIAGAIDAWMDPQTIPLARNEPAAEEGERMMENTMKFRCAGHLPGITKADQRKSILIMIGGTLILTVAWVWLHVRVGDHPYVDSFSMMPFLAPYLVSMKYTYLKGRPAVTQATFIMGSILAIALMFVLTGWVTARM